MNQENLSPQSRSWKMPILLLIIFTVLGTARLNQFYFYNPDSSDYVLMARGFVEFQEYRQFDRPGEPYFTLRPPGMSVLLIPAAIIAPYDVIAAKVTVLMTALVMIWLFYTLAWRLISSTDPESTESLSPLRWSVLLVSLVLMTNPYVLVYSTIVMSEIPFMACTLAVLYLFSAEEEKWSLGKLVCLTGLLVFIPFLRTIGVAMILAVGLWCLFSRKRWICLIPVGFAVGTTAFWMFRNSQFKTMSYSSIALQEMKTAGVVGTLISMLNRLLVHIDGLFQKIFPGLPGTVPEYSGVLSGEYHALPGSPLIYSLGSVVIIVISLAGMLCCWKRGGAVCLLYLCLSLGVLSVWPWMQTRFSLPWLPMILVFVPAGLFYIKESSLGQRAGVLKTLAVGGVAVVAALLFSQTWVDANLITTNHLMKTESEEELSNEDLIMFASDFVKAGEWLNQNTAPHARVLTRRAEVSTASHRYQRLFYFEPSNIEQLHKAIQSMGQCYLVTYSKHTNDMFPRYLLDDDLIYRFTPVYEEDGIVVIEVTPNYEGTVRDQYWRDEEAMELARKRLARNPRRISVCMTYLNQLLKAEEYDQIIAFIGDLEQAGIQDARFMSMLGWSYLGKRQYDQALEEFARATRTPGQKMIRGNLNDGIKLALKRRKAAQENQGKSQHEKPGSYLKLTDNMWQLVMFDKAEKFAHKVLDSKQATTAELDQAHVWLARLALIQGNAEQALQELTQVQDADNEAAQALRHRLDLEKMITSAWASESASSKVPDSSQILKLAKLYEEQGVPGKALKLLQQAHDRNDSDTQILRELARLQLFYSLLDEAENSYLSLQKTSPDDPEIKKALQQIARFRETPRY
ncbi:tetratricopeptide repeat protein [Gimesia benthica]|uniref:Tetratricopeptide repeat protein n=1 Tax=Gimesia benthica TaxID=2608982 RepID=A0A6I6AKG3_9PLAN|nr:tetratricopeptide repeat protein [Gimesia benthica]QGQ26636.1 tetratricopeptide repeat protein [Gimesia benthica]